MPDQSLALLAMLLDRPGELVTREEIQARLWPHGTVVEFEHSIHSAMKRLREALSDDSATPRYIETLPRKGYRFIGNLETAPPTSLELVAGTVVSHYRIMAEAGRGATGVVYKAEDLTLGRVVALKFLSEELAAHPPALERMRREARLIGALNHPGICTLHELGEAAGRVFLAMEFLEGEPLRVRMGRGPVSEAEFCEIALQVTRALEAAHGQGILHRDIKPDNLFLTRSGQVKLTDFGLAKSVSQEDGTVAQSAVTGTSGYMSPEQARGEPVDARSDIYSLGRVLAELAGEGLASVAPVIAKAMASDPAEPWQSAGEFRTALEGIRQGIGEKIARQAWWRRRLVLILTLLVAAVLAGVIWRLREGTPPGALRAVPLTSYAGFESCPSLSPDGSKVAFGWNGDKQDNYDIYVKQIGGSGPPVRLTTDPAAEYCPAWSPDDRWIAFVRQQPDNVAIMLMPSLGGPQRKLTEIAQMGDLWWFPLQLSWTPDAKWLAFSAGDSAQGPTSIWAINVDTSERRRLTTLTQSAGVWGDSSPSISPDGRALAFARQVLNLINELYVQRLTPDLRPEGEPAKLTDQRYPEVQGIAWTANGREIVYGAGAGGTDSLWRVPVSGRRAPERLPYAFPSALQPVISRSPPRLVYTYWLWNENLWRLDTRTGERKMLVSSTYYQENPEYSPDGRKIAFESNRSGNAEVWTCDADGTNCVQITSFEGPQCGTPPWSPDSRWLALDSRGEGRPEIYVVAADGGKPRRITDNPAGDLIPSWSHDGLWVYFDSDRSGRSEIWKVAKDGGEPVQVTRSGVAYALESPDGNYLYYIKLSPGNSSPGLFRMPAQGGEETRVLEGPVGGDFQATAKGIYFQPNAKTIQFLDTASGKVRIIATLDKPTAGLSVSPDGSYVVYSRLDANNKDLMLVEGFR
ncbi:MAG: protein kinase domain-containing protein [Bryobacteraceae bacterium]